MDNRMQDIREGDLITLPTMDQPAKPKRDQYEFYVRFFLNGQPIPSMSRGRDRNLYFNTGLSFGEKDLQPQLIKVGSSAVDTYNRLKIVLVNIAPDVDPSVSTSQLISVKFDGIKLNTDIHGNGTTSQEQQLAFHDGTEGRLPSCDDNDRWNNFFARLTNERQAGIHIHYLTYEPKVDNTIRYLEPWKFRD